MIDAITNILLGAVGSILATLILFLLSSLLDLKYKEKFYTQLELAKTAVYQIANMHRYPTDYPLIMQQVDVLYLSCRFYDIPSEHRFTAGQQYKADADMS